MNYNLDFNKTLRDELFKFVDCVAFGMDSVVSTQIVASLIFFGSSGALNI